MKNDMEMAKAAKLKRDEQSRGKKTVGGLVQVGGTGEEDAVVDEHVEGDDVGSTQSGATAVRCQPGPSELRSPGRYDQP